MYIAVASARNTEADQIIFVFRKANHMTSTQSLVSSLQRQERRYRNRLTDRMLQAAQVRHLPILYQDLMIVSRQEELLVAAAVLPCRLWPSGEAEDFVFLYLDVAGMDDLTPGFYTVQVFRDDAGAILENARLVNAQGVFVRNCNFFLEDRYEDRLGTRNPSLSRNTLVDSWIKRGEAYGLEGVLGDGRPFVIVLEF